MTALPTTHTFSAGEVVTDTTMNNNITAVLNFLMAPPIVQARQTVAQSLPNNTATVLTFDSEDVDSSGMHSTVTNTGRLTAVYPGWYAHLPGYSQAANATGQRVMSIQVNGTVVNGSGADQTSAVAAISTRGIGRPMLIFLNVGDFSELSALQNSGGALNTAVTTSEQSTFAAFWVSS